MWDVANVRLRGEREEKGGGVRREWDGGGGGGGWEVKTMVDTGKGTQTRKNRRSMGRIFVTEDK